MASKRHLLNEIERDIVLIMEEKINEIEKRSFQSNYHWLFKRKSPSGLRNQLRVEINLFQMIDENIDLADLLEITAIIESKLDCMDSLTADEVPKRTKEIIWDFVNCAKMNQMFRNVSIKMDCENKCFTLNPSSLLELPENEKEMEIAHF